VDIEALGRLIRRPLGIFRHRLRHPHRLSYRQRRQLRPLRFGALLPLLGGIAVVAANVELCMGYVQGKWGMPCPDGSTFKRSSDWDNFRLSPGQNWTQYYSASFLYFKLNQADSQLLDIDCHGGWTACGNGSNPDTKTYWSTVMAATLRVPAAGQSIWYEHQEVSLYAKMGWCARAFITSTDRLGRCPSTS